MLYVWYTYNVVHLLCVIYIHLFAYSSLFIYYRNMCISSLEQWFYYVCFILFDHVHAFYALILSES